MHFGGVSCSLGVAKRYYFGWSLVQGKVVRSYCGHIEQKIEDYKVFSLKLVLLFKGHIL